MRSMCLLLVMAMGFGVSAFATPVQMKTAVCFEQQNAPPVILSGETVCAEAVTLDATLYTRADILPETVANNSQTLYCRALSGVRGIGDVPKYVATTVRDDRSTNHERSYALNYLAASRKFQHDHG